VGRVAIRHEVAIAGELTLALATARLVQRAQQRCHDFRNDGRVGPGAGIEADRPDPDRGLRELLRFHVHHRNCVRPASVVVTKMLS
jgi:hypothetical protein